MTKKATIPTTVEIFEDENATHHAKALETRARLRTARERLPLAEQAVEQADARVRVIEATAMKRAIGDDATEDEYQAGQHAAAVSALRLATISHASAKKEVGNAQTGLRYSDTEVAHVLRDMLQPMLPAAEFIVMASTPKAVPTAADRAHGFVVLAQDGPTDRKSNGMIAGDVIVRYYRSPLHLPLSTQALKDQLAKSGDTFTQVGFTSHPGADVDQVKVTVSGAVVASPIIASIRTQALDQLGRAFVSRLALSGLYYDETPKTDLYTGLYSTAWATAVPFDAALVEEHVDGTERTLTLDTKIGVRFDKPLDKGQTPLSVIEALVDHVAGSFVSGLGVVESIEVLPSTNDDKRDATRAADLIRTGLGEGFNASEVGFERESCFTLRATLTSSTGAAEDHALVAA